VPTGPSSEAGADSLSAMPLQVSSLGEGLQMDTFYFDRIRINLFKEPTILKELLPMETLKNLSRAFQIDQVEHKRQFTGYHSRIDTTAPTREFLKLLSDHEPDLGPYRISYIEIARDRITQSQREAIEQCQNFNARKKWATSHFSYTQFEDPQKDEEKFGTITQYSMSKLFGIRAYGRMSKVTGDPCFHREWFIRTPKVIQEKSGIKEIGDLLAFDFQHFFKIQDEEMLIYNENIDQFKLGKWARGWSRRKKFSRRELWSIGCHGSAYAYGKNYGELVQYLRKCKREIKARSGPRTAWDRKILKLRDYSRFKTLSPN